MTEKALKISEKVSGTNRRLRESIDEHLQELATLGILPHQLADGKDFYAPVGDSSLIEYGRRVNAKRIYMGHPSVVISDEEEDYRSIALLTRLQELVDYDRAVMQVFDPTDAGQMEKLGEIYPEWFSKRSEYLQKIADLQLQYANLLMDGIQSRDDLELVIGLWILSDMGYNIFLQMHWPVHKLIYAQKWIPTEPDFFQHTMPKKVYESLQNNIKSKLARGDDVNSAVLLGVVNILETLEDNSFIERSKGVLPEWAGLPRIMKYAKRVNDYLPYEGVADALGRYDEDQYISLGKWNTRGYKIYADKTRDLLFSKMT